MAINIVEMFKVLISFVNEEKFEAHKNRSKINILYFASMNCIHSILINCFKFSSYALLNISKSND